VPEPTRPLYFAVCGKGGVGKTAISALLARVLLEQGVRPLLLVDGDPVGGLVSAVGERAPRTLGQVRAELIAMARGAEARERIADQLDYLVQEALVEREGYALLAMGHRRERGCYCPVNTLLRDAIDLISTPYAAVLIDAEAGIEQINRQVTRRVDRVVAVTDGSARGAEAVRLIAELVGADRVRVVVNRADRAGELPAAVDLVGLVPEDPLVRGFDREGRPLWELPGDAPALVAVQRIAAGLSSERREA